MITCSISSNNSGFGSKFSFLPKLQIKPLLVSKFLPLFPPKLLQNIPCPHTMRVLLPEHLHLAFVRSLLKIHRHRVIPGRFEEQSEAVHRPQRIRVRGS